MAYLGVKAIVDIVASDLLLHLRLLLLKLELVLLVMLLQISKMFLKTAH